VIERIVEVETPGTVIRKERGSLFVRPPNGDPELIPLDSIAALILHEGTVLSGAVVSALTDLGAVVVFCGAKALPVAIVWPLVGHHIQSMRMKNQVAASLPLRKRLWSSIVECKIDGQSAILERVKRSRILRPFSGQVRSGDPENVEAQAARSYWPALFGKDFRRGRYIDPANAMLNYGYAILRSGMARAVSAAGLHPSFGLHHRDGRNALALVDDLMEPYRPCVDLLVYDLMQEEPLFDRGSKASLAKVLVTDLSTDRGQTPVSGCMTRTASSLVAAFEECRANIWFPTDIIP
jgi:CRISPR-associated protein Cas1